MKKAEGKKRQNINESENEEDCAADQCLKVLSLKWVYVLRIQLTYFGLFTTAYRKRSYLGAM